MLRSLLRPWRLVLLLGLILATGPGARGEERMQVSVGRFDDGPGASHSLALETLSGRGGIEDTRVMVGVTTTTRGGIYLFGGVYQDVPLANDWVFTPSFAVGRYLRGRDKDLGHPLILRSSFRLGYDLDPMRRIGFGYDHFSNASLSEENPGAESYVAYGTFPWNP